MQNSDAKITFVHCHWPTAGTDLPVKMDGSARAAYFDKAHSGRFAREPRGFDCDYAANR